MQPKEEKKKNQLKKKIKHKGWGEQQHEDAVQEVNLSEKQVPIQLPKNNALKKKVKNEGWDQKGGVSCLGIPPNLSQHFGTNHIKTQRRYKNISEIGAKYDFNTQAILGSGFASTVYLGNQISNKQMVCIKAIDLMRLGLSGPHVILIHQEIECLKKFNSDYIVKLYDVYESATFIYLVMQLCPAGDLYKLLKMFPTNIPSQFVSTIIRQITHGLMQIHDKQIIHRDMKTENIFILKYPQNQNEEIKVKIGDLGFCISLDELQKKKKMGKTPQNVGSPIYMSTQICQKLEYSFSSDIYSLGIIWYQLYHKKAPWEAKSQAQLLNKKLKEQVTHWRSDIEPQIKQIILKCISNDPSKRPKCVQIIKLFSQKSSKTIEQEINEQNKPK